ncbi:protein YgfX [Gilliamella intestini]|uniref:Membrane-bound toxin component of toxin-antitoxin system n=1 Tax=Gilliamella intestini TaxID=1798183 RepID=A0A1C3ZFK6_9GAMM|nr:Membrane-bound toxin component of toxin-antitoxin system [Gilliamella intestini]
MWSTKLSVSKRQLLISTIFYLILIILCLVMFANTSLNAYTFIIIPLLLIEWWRSVCYLKTIKREFALFHYINQIYWHKQRWHLIHKPLIFRYVVILNLKSRHNGKHSTLWLMVDNLQPNDWRTLRFYLKQIEFT